MVLLENIFQGQFVEVKLGDKIVCGTVCYKGHLNGESGNWVGVELEYPLGKHNGCWRGRQYFKAANKCGIFTHASNIRFRRMLRKSRDTFKKCENVPIRPDNFVTHQKHSEFNSCYSISKAYLQQAKSAFQPGVDYMFMPQERYPLLHTMSRSSSVKHAGCIFSSANTCSVCQVGDSFTSLHRSIPHYTMPHEALVRWQKNVGQKNGSGSQPRFMSV